ncbi:MAG TPA: FAD-linked oxidase C-terminal domain-containing protein, partial [Rhodothermales bacterium]
IAFIEDASVPVEHLAEYIAGLTAAADELRTEMVMYAHASAGTLHVRPFINTKDAREVRKMEELARASMELVRGFGGSVSSEHGDGIARSWLTEPLVGRELYEVYREIKHIFDPHGVLNPNRVVDAPPMTENLRLGPSYRTIPVVTEFDYSADGGFAGAIELCNGNGACRKLDSGTMCPSFMVTREEKDSTRGRANALRAAISGLIPVEELTGERMHEVMDLCVQCKACKTECPSNVDMARLKSEWLSKVWDTQRMPLRTRIFANLPQIAAMVSGPAARFVNRFNSSKPFRAIAEMTLGISARRELPRFARRSFVQWFGRQKWRTEGPEVVLFPDTFANYQHPEIAQAAARFLDRAGYRVIVPEGFLCCGRTSLSKGLLTRAQHLALRVVERLHPYAEAGIPIIGLEPSCILTFRDEFLSLLPGDPRVEAVARASETFEEFVAKRRDEPAFRALVWKGQQRNVLLHGHCHQKALVGTVPAEQCLSLPAGYSVETVDSGCCGMAGAFGYEREHYDISLAMAERRLAPAVRAASGDTLIAAPGTSCRAQIADTTGRRALHPAEILLEALA